VPYQRAPKGETIVVVEEEDALMKRGSGPGWSGLAFDLVRPLGPQP
jgi:hypothetical protein